MSAPLDIEPGETPTAVYRCYDPQGALLYVGMTNRPRMRFRSHSYTARWWPEVTARKVIWYASRSDAEAAEAAAIRGENPVHNIRRMELPRVKAKPTARRSRGLVRHNGFFISAMRAKHGLTQAQLAEKAGISRDHLAHLEIEARFAAMITLNRIARALSVPVAAMLREDVA